MLDAALRPRAWGRRPGFVFTDLLTCLAVLALLGALLLPALPRAGGEAQGDRCVSHQRQLGVAFASYLADWGEAYPYAQQTDPDPAVGRNYPHAENTEHARSWNRALAPYLGGYERGPRFGREVIAEVLWCPQNPWEPFGATMNNNIPVTYGMNSDGAIGGFPQNWARGTTADAAQSNPPHPPRRQAEIVQPSAMLLLGEVANGPPITGEDLDGQPFTRFANPNIGASGVTVSSRNFQNREGEIRYRNEWMQGRQIARFARLSHDDGWNGLRADGHVRHDSFDFLQSITPHQGPSYTSGPAVEASHRYWLGQLR